MSRGRSTKKIKKNRNKTMTRVKRGNVAKKRRKKTFQITKGFCSSSSSLYRTANQQKMKALQFSYRDRQQKKRAFRSVWIARLNSGARICGINYSRLVNRLQNSKILINRKLFSQLAIHEQPFFYQLIQELA